MECWCDGYDTMMLKCEHIMKIYKKGAYKSTCLPTNRNCWKVAVPRFKIQKYMSETACWPATIPVYINNILWKVLACKASSWTIQNHIVWALIIEKKKSAQSKTWNEKFKNRNAWKLSSNIHINNS